jgi:GTP-binding protein EngB required for normal cell division
MIGETTKKLIDDITKKMNEGKDYLSSSFGELLIVLIEQLQLSKEKKFVFLLAGRTGVGKSSTVNSLMGQEIAPVGKYDATTMEVQDYEKEINGIKCTIIDTPGLCDDIPEKGNDQKYIEFIQNKVTQVDSLWFVTRLDDSRITSDEMRGIKVISEAFTPKIWQHAVIIFTRADKADDYLQDLQERTKRIRAEIAKYTGDEVASEIPSVAVDNKSQTTPDGKRWLEELYTQVFVRMSQRGAIPFLMATASRVNKSQIGSSNGEPNWKFYTESDTQQQAKEEYYADATDGFDFTSTQKAIIKQKLIEAIPALAVAGAGVGAAVAGPVGAAIGGVVGAALGSIFYFFS